MKPGVGPVFDRPLEIPADLDNLAIPNVKVNVTTNPLHHPLTRPPSNMSLTPSP